MEKPGILQPGQKQKEKINHGGFKMIREIDTAVITANIKEMCIEANHFLSKDMDADLK